MRMQLSVIQYPSGKYGFVGSGIPVSLSYTSKDGSPITDDQYRIIKNYGPGLANVKHVVFESEAQAWEAYKKLQA